MTKFIKHNARPETVKDQSDCVIRAISTAAGQDYLQTRKELNALKRQMGLDSYKHKAVSDRYIQGLGAIRIQTMSKEDTHRTTGDDFAIDHPTGTYILRMAGHLTACVEGRILDTWDCSDKMVYYAWRLNPKK